MNALGHKELISELERLQMISREIADRLAKTNSGIKGFLPELNKLRTHLETYHDTKMTEKLAELLKNTSDIGRRSKKTKGYTEIAADTFKRLSQGETRDFGTVLWRLGWLNRLLFVLQQEQPAEPYRRHRSR